MRHDQVRAGLIAGRGGGRAARRVPGGLFGRCGPGQREGKPQGPGAAPEPGTLRFRRARRARKPDGIRAG